MSETSPKPNGQLPANLTTLEQQLRQMAMRTKGSSQSPKDRPDRLQGPTLVIRGK